MHTVHAGVRTRTHCSSGIVDGCLRTVALSSVGSHEDAFEAPDQLVLAVCQQAIVRTHCRLLCQAQHHLQKQKCGSAQQRQRQAHSHPKNP